MVGGDEDLRIKENVSLTNPPFQTPLTLPSTSDTNILLT